MLSKDLSQTKKNEEEAGEKKEIKGMKLTLTPFNVVFGNGCRSVLGVVLG